MERKTALQEDALRQHLTIMEADFPNDRTEAGTKSLQPKVKRIPLDDYQTGSVPVAGRRTLDSMLDAHACLDPEPAHASWIPCVPAFLTRILILALCSYLKKALSIVRL